MKGKCENFIEQTKNKLNRMDCQLMPKAEAIPIVMSRILPVYACWRFKYLCVFFICFFLAGCGEEFKLEDQRVFYSCDKDSWVLNEEETRSVQFSPTAYTQTVEFSALCVLRKYSDLKPLDGTVEMAYLGKPNTLETVIFRGEYTRNSAEPDWVQGYSIERVRRPNGELLYEGYWFCPSNPWLSWNGPSYMCRQNYNVISRFASAYLSQYDLNSYANWVREHSLSHVKRVPRSVRFTSNEQRLRISELFIDFTPYNQEIESKVSIVKPEIYKTYPTSFDRINIEVKNTQTLEASTGLMQLQWRRIGQGPKVINDVILSNPPNFWEWPTNGPEYVQLVNGSGWVSGEMGYFTNHKKGLYQLRARLADEALAKWSEPVRFWIGSPSFVTDNMSLSDTYFSESHLNDIAISKNNNASNGYVIFNDSKQGLEQSLEIMTKKNEDTDAIKGSSGYLNYLSAISAINMETEIVDTRSEPLKLPQAHDVYFDLGDKHFSNRAEQNITHNTRVRFSCVPLKRCENLSRLLLGQSDADGTAQLLKIGLPDLGLSELELPKIRVLVILDESEEEKIIRQLAQ